MTDPDPIVFIVDDDLSVRRSTERLVQAAGLKVQTFTSAKEFLKNARFEGPACLVLDVRMPGLSGMDLQQELIKAKIEIPVVFITGYGDIPTSVRAMKAGAVEFLTKPFRDQDILDAIERGLEQHRIIRQRNAEIAPIQRRYDSLTPREREVLPLVGNGFRNAQIAAELGTSEKTIKVHRGHVMRKMRAESLAHLIHISKQLGPSFRGREGGDTRSTPPPRGASKS